jgi:hypothetical protein
MIHDQDRCSPKGCTRIVTGRTMIIARDGRRYCKHHGDRLPPYLRKPPQPKAKKT